MNKAQYLMDVLTPAALEKLKESHVNEEVEISNSPYFPNPDASRQKMVQTYKDANAEIIEKLRGQLAVAHYEHVATANLKGMLAGVGRCTEEEKDYADEKYDRTRAEIDKLMEQFENAVKTQREIEHWFK